MDWDMFIKASILVLYIVGMLLVAFFTRKRSKTVGIRCSATAIWAAG